MKEVEYGVQRKYRRDCSKIIRRVNQECRDEKKTMEEEQVRRTARIKEEVNGRG